jgi:TolB-like protein
MDGMVEEIITALSRFKSLFVIARNSSVTYKGKTAVASSHTPSVELGSHAAVEAELGSSAFPGVRCSDRKPRDGRLPAP